VPHISRRFLIDSVVRSSRTPVIVAVASVAASAGITLGAAPAALAASPPTITSAFTPNLIGLGDSSATALSFTITNPDASASLSSVAFTDTLPTGLSVDNPNGQNGTCGSAGVITATPGSQTISLTGGSLKPTTSCTISFSVIAAQAGTFTNSTGLVSSSAGASAAGDTQTLTVIPPPTVSVSQIKDKAKYAFGAVVKPTYSCTQPADPTALSDCSAQDDVGNNVASGHAIDTKTPGSHSLTVSATSADGSVTTDTINYTVLADNRFTIAKLTPKTGGTLGFQLALPGAGKITAVEVAGTKTFGTYSSSVTAKHTLHVTIKLTPGATKLLTASRSAKVTLKVTYTPKGGVKRTVSRRGILLKSK
jgi:hypothetical protein